MRRLISLGLAWLLLACGGRTGLEVPPIDGTGGLPEYPGGGGDRAGGGRGGAGASGGVGGVSHGGIGGNSVTSPSGGTHRGNSCPRFDGALVDDVEGGAITKAVPGGATFLWVPHSVLGSTTEIGAAPAEPPRAMASGTVAMEVSTDGDYLGLQPYFSPCVALVGATGVAFYARTTQPGQATIQMDSLASLSPSVGGWCESACSPALTQVMVTDAWQRIELRFDGLKPASAPLALEAFRSVLLALNRSKPGPFEIWMDDVEILRE